MISSEGTIVPECLHPFQDVSDTAIVILENPYDMIDFPPEKQDSDLNFSNISFVSVGEYIENPTKDINPTQASFEDDQPGISVTSIEERREKSEIIDTVELKHQTEIDESCNEVRDSSKSSDDEDDADYNVQDEDGESGSESDYQVNQAGGEREELSREDGRRKRTRNEAQWKANKRKKARTSGEEYTSSRKTVIRAPRLKACCKETCKLRCIEVFCNEDRQNILQSFWNKDVSYDRKRQFVASCVDETPVQRRRNRNGTREDISQNLVDHALRRTLGGGIIKGDLRKDHIPQNKIPEEIKQGIRDHINKFPYYESHYSREKTSRKYLECDLSVSKMYQLYHEEAIAANTLPEHIGKLWLYRDMFNADFNLSFKKPSNDTCDKCDSLTMKMKDYSEPGQREALEIEYNNQIEDFQLRYKMKTAEKKCAKEAKNKKNETVAGRGGNEVASAILKWIQVSGLDPQIEELTIWSDNCPSQNRNLMMVMCYFHIFNICPNLRTINHKYLLGGHTHLEVDSDHAMIEKQVKKAPAFQIATPWDWEQLVRITLPKFSVIDMV
nr:unnamed protein product [Callosobruchus analis]